VSETTVRTEIHPWRISLTSAGCPITSGNPHHAKFGGFVRLSSRIRGGLLNGGLNLNSSTMKTYRLPLLLIIFACASASLASAQSLFVTNRYSNNVAVIDSSTNQVLTEILVGSFPIRVAMTPNKLKAFVSNAKSSNVSVIDTVARTNIATIPVSRVPGESAVTPDGGRLFVVHQGGHHQLCPVDVIDTTTNQIITTVNLPGTWLKDILFTPDGRSAYVANQSVGEVDVIDTATYQQTNIPTAAGSRRLCISPTGDRVYCANYDGNSVSVINTATKQLIATIPVGQRPRAIAITPNGKEVYTADVISGTVSVINTTSLSVIATIPTGQYPWELVITADGTKAFVSNTYSDTVSVINTATHAVLATIPAGHGPFISQITPDQTKLYVSDTRSTTVTVINISSLTVAATIANVGMQPFDMTFGP
jgi:YVTN family beta-propeller protein